MYNDLSQPMQNVNHEYSAFMLKNLNEKIGNFKDMVVAYATAHEYQSFSNVTEGSFYVRVLCRQIALLACNHDFAEILQSVTDEFVKAAEHYPTRKQIPEYVVYNCKKKILNPGIAV